MATYSRKMKAVFSLLALAGSAVAHNGHVASIGKNYNTTSTSVVPTTTLVTYLTTTVCPVTLMTTDQGS